MKALLCVSTFTLLSLFLIHFAGVDFTDVDGLVFEVAQDSQINDAVDFALFQFYAGAATVPVEKTTWGQVKSRYQSQ